jgi:hypothetical protein
MGYEILFDGVPISCSTPAEAVALAQQVAKGAGSNGAAKRRPGRKPDPKKAAEKQGNRERLRKNAITFLEVVDGAGDGGATAAKLASALRMKDKRGLGAASISATKLVESLEFDPRKVFTSEKTEEGKVWKAGSELQAALKKLKKPPQGGDV